MNFMDLMNKGIVRGEFEVIAKDKDGNIVQHYKDDNVVVNDAKPVTAFLVNQAVKDSTGAIRPEYTGDGYDKQTDFVDKLLDPNIFQVSYIKLGGGFPRKRSFCDSGDTETPIIPSELKNDSDARSSLYSYIDFGSTMTDTIPTGWAQYGTTVTQQPYHSSSLLYPRKTDWDLVDRDYQWAKRILRYKYLGDPHTGTTTFKAMFSTTMRYLEGNGPEFNCTGGKETGSNRLYEYREAGLYIGMMPWQYVVDGANTIQPHPRETYGDIFQQDNGAGSNDSTLSSNIRDYRYWDGHSDLLGGSYTTPTEPQWPKSTSEITWESSILNRGELNCVDSSSTLNSTLDGKLYEGYYMVARKTFPIITKTSDLEFTINWYLVFG